MLLTGQLVSWRASSTYGTDQYVAIVAGVMFVLGIMLMIQSLRQRSAIRQRWDPLPRDRDRTSKAFRNELL